MITASDESSVLVLFWQRNLRPMSISRTTKYICHRRHFSFLRTCKKSRTELAFDIPVPNKYMYYIAAKMRQWNCRLLSQNQLLKVKFTRGIIFPFHENAFSRLSDLDNIFSQQGQSYKKTQVYGTPRKLDTVNICASKQSCSSWPTGKIKPDQVWKTAKRLGFLPPAKNHWKLPGRGVTWRNQAY